MPPNMPIRHMASRHEYAGRPLCVLAVQASSTRMQNLRAIRRARGLTQVQLAERAGIDQGTVSKIERGYDQVSLRTIYALAEALNVEPPELFSLPELHQRVLRAIGQLSPDRQSAALTVIESMASVTDAE